FGVGQAFAQGSDEPVILAITLENFVSYAYDTADISRYATDQQPTTRIASRNFSRTLGIRDVTRVNGREMKGLFLDQNTNYQTRPNPSPGQAIGDVTIGQMSFLSISLQDTDGTPLGSIFAQGLTLATPLPGVQLPTPSKPPIGPEGPTGYDAA